jgi:ubiquinone/menaquinone biosynthesis C-methylase UbiE
VSLPLHLAHRRYIQQASWTQQLRRHIFTRAGLPNARRVLEIGCGTGAILATINATPNAKVFGIDIDLDSLKLAQGTLKNSLFVAADAHSLPIPDQSFDITFFHFVLLWLSDPMRALSEARRITHPGGAVIAFAEPDYSLRHPPDPVLSKLAQLQADSLRAQGADPNIGSQLPELFSSANISVVESGRLDMNPESLYSADLNLELEVLRSDLINSSQASQIDQIPKKLHENKALLVSWQVPTFFCWGRVRG